jgi:hypothetical protein
VQYRLLEEWKVGRAARTLDEVVKTTARLLTEPQELQEMREQARVRRKTDVSGRIARWLVEAVRQRQPAADGFQAGCESRTKHGSVAAAVLTELN